MTPPNKYNNFSVIDFKQIEIFDCLTNNSKIIVLRKFTKLQENTHKKVNEMRKSTHEQNES